MTIRRLSIVGAAGLLLLAVVWSACGSDPDPAQPPADATAGTQTPAQPIADSAPSPASVSSQSSGSGPLPKPTETSMPSASALPTETPMSTASKQPTGAAQSPASTVTAPVASAPLALPPAPVASPPPTPPAPPVASVPPKPTPAAQTAARVNVPTPVSPPDAGDRDLTEYIESLDIKTLLPFDAIPAILDPVFVDAEEADKWFSPDSLVLGLSINGDHRAYSIPLLSRHEIVNDTVGGKPVAVTW